MFCHIFHLPSYCVSMLVHILLIQGHPLVALIVWFLFFVPSGWTRMPKNLLSYLCFSRLKLYSCYITKFDQVRFEPLCVRSTQSPRFVIDLNFQNFFVCFGPTDSSISVIPRSLSRSRFSISVQPIWTFWSHQVAVTVHSYASRCHRVVPLGHTDRVGIYRPTGEILEISSKPLSPRVSCSTASGLRIAFSSPATSRRWSPPPSTEIFAAVASSSPN